MTKIRAIAYTCNRHPADEVEEVSQLEGCGWINGKVTLDDGRSFDAGGGWVDANGTIDPYGLAEAGDVKPLAEALGKSPEVFILALQAACPTRWPV